MQKFERLDECSDRAHACNAVAIEERVIERIGAGKRGGVAHRDLGALFGPPGLECDHRLAQLARAPGGSGKGSDILQALDMKADGGDALIFRQGCEHAGHIDIRLVADGEHRSDRQGSPRHGEVAADIPRLGDDGDTARDRLKPVFVGP